MTLTLLAVSPANRGPQSHDATISADGVTTLCVVPGETLTACVIKAASLLTRMGAEEAKSEPIFGPGVVQLVDTQETPKTASEMVEYGDWVLGYLAASGPVKNPPVGLGTYSKMATAFGAFSTVTGGDVPPLRSLLQELCDRGDVTIKTSTSGTQEYMLTDHAEESAPGAETVIDGLTLDARVVLGYMQRKAVEVVDPEHKRTARFTNLGIYLRDSMSSEQPGVVSWHGRAHRALKELHNAGLLSYGQCAQLHDGAPFYGLTTEGYARITAEVV